MIAITGATGNTRRPRTETLLACGEKVRLISRDAQEIRLSKREYDLLRFLAASPDHVVTHKEILTAVWGPAHTEDTVYLRVYVNQLRQKLEPDPTDPRIILTEPGVGYRLATQS